MLCPPRSLPHKLSGLLLLVLLPALSAWAAERPAAYRSAISTPAAATYALPVNVSRLANADGLAKLTPEQKQRLAELGFVVVPDAAEQMFMLYEDYPSDTDQPVPNFITVDSLLHAYHLFFSYALRTVESQQLTAACSRLTDLCRFHNTKFANSLPPGPLQEAAARNVVYFTVAKSLLTAKPQTTGLSATYDRLVAAELKLIAAHAGRAKSPLMGVTVHYSQFVPRGHYTRTEALKRYFLAMMWYGQIGLDLDPGDDADLARTHTRQALLLTRILAGDDASRKLWAQIYEPTCFFVGASDDLGFRQYEPLARQAFGSDLTLASLGNEQALDAFLQKAQATLPAPGIAPYFNEADAAGNIQRGTAKAQGRQFRFMGQRFIPDSYLLQQLVSPQVLPAAPDDARDMPMGLDVPAVLGSERARELLLGMYQQGRYPQYESQLTKLREEFAGKSEDEWWQNLYWGWIFSLQGLTEKFGAGYPAFMQTEPWQDKELQTAMGSWAQLRHDTILYAKPSGAEMGGAEPTPVLGYVEPVPEVWGRLGYLTYLSRTGLERRGLLSPRLQGAFNRFADILAFLKRCAELELQGKALSAPAYDRIQYFGGELERLQLTVLSSSDSQFAPDNWYEITNESDRHMATIADIHTAFDTALEIGVGPAYRLYVVVPRPDGKLQVTKGGVFSYYEFGWPVSDRLTDEAWLSLLKAGKQPAQPAWTQSFIVGPKYPGYED